MLKERDSISDCNASMLSNMGSNVVPSEDPESSGEPAVCSGCGGKIVDRYYLLAVDRQWHNTCLKCCECKLPLDSELTCFAREGNIYCKVDYYRLFSAKRCARCQSGIGANELVMRARELVYHLACFACISCHRPLTKGDQFGMRDHMIYCKAHYEMLVMQNDYCSRDSSDGNLLADGGRRLCGSDDGHPGQFLPNAPSPTTDGRLPFFNGVGAVQKGRPRKRKVVEPDLAVAIRGMTAGLDIMHHGEIVSSMDHMGYDSAGGTPPQTQQQRTKRMRTSFKHHQLRTMKSYFAINQNPDAKDLKQLAQKTGLSKRVLQVWFQNARAKWRRNMLRQENQSQAGGQSSKSDEETVLAPSSASSSSQPPPPPSSHLAMDHMTPDDAPQTLNFGELY